ncbi:MAG: hypothetical protein EA355_06190 [Rhodobacteraceae bacterium]|nr:MAG: hypothetical protein EA355_06190 [Paracoccaceae bacterium]
MRMLIAALAVTLPFAAAAEEAPSEKLVTVVATAEPQTQLMAMVLTMAAVQQGAEAHILLCGPGADIALIDAPDSATAPQAPRGMSPQSLMMAIMETGVPVEVCAIYLPNLGAGPEVLIDGVAVAQPPAMAAKIMAEGVRVLSF